MKFSVELLDWEGLHFRGLSGKVTALLDGQKQKIDVNLDPTKRGARANRGTYTLALVGDEVQQPIAQAAYAELLMVRIPMSSSRARRVELSGQITRADPEGRLWFVKTPDSVGKLELAAEMEGQILAEARVTVKDSPTRATQPLERKFHDISVGKAITIRVGDVVGVPLALNDVTGKLRWYVR